jgi:hypothetical protein
MTDVRQAFEEALKIYSAFAKIAPVAPPPLRASPRRLYWPTASPRAPTRHLPDPEIIPLILIFARGKFPSLVPLVTRAARGTASRSG